MAGNNTLPNVVCCFCGSHVPDPQMTTLVVCPPAAEGESQTLFCHAGCLIERLDPRVPHHPALDDAVE